MPRLIVVSNRVSVPTERQGTDLLSDPQALDQLVYFLDEQRWAARGTPAGRRSVGRA